MDLHIENIYICTYIQTSKQTYDASTYNNNNPVEYPWVAGKSSTKITHARDSVCAVCHKIKHRLTYENKVNKLLQQRWRRVRVKLFHENNDPIVIIKNNFSTSYRGISCKLMKKQTTAHIHFIGIHLRTFAHIYIYVKYINGNYSFTRSLNMIWASIFLLYTEVNKHIKSQF